MKILLTGGTGFLGQNLQEFFGHEYKIFAPSHQELDVTRAADVEEIFRGHNFDAVIHAAIEGGGNTAEKILRGYWNIANHAGKVSRILYFGSGAEYGKHRDLIKVKEEEIGREVPGDSYGFAKLLCNEMARRSKNILNLRLFGIYGPHEGYLFRFISNSIARVLCGLNLKIRQDVIFDYLWAGDLMEIVRRSLVDDVPWRDANITPTQSVTLTQIADLLGSIAGKQLKPEIETPELNFQYTGDNARLLAAFPGFSFTDYATGIRRLFLYYKSQMQTLDREKLIRDEYGKACRVRKTAAPSRESR